MSNHPLDPVLIRQQKKQNRLALTAESVQQASTCAVLNLLTLEAFLSSKRIAIYASFAGELDPVGLLESCPDKQFFLPVIKSSPAKHLLFYRHTPAAKLQRNRFGIEQPDTLLTEGIPSSELDFILAPLLAYDLKGNRLGQGGGYYDRTMAFRTQKGCPHYVGFAYQWQQVSQLEAKPWDVALDAVVTDNGIVRV